MTSSICRIFMIRQDHTCPEKKRAAQFAPFKSLGGYHESIDDVADEVNDVVWEDIER